MYLFILYIWQFRGQPLLYVLSCLVQEKCDNTTIFVLSGQAVQNAGVSTCFIKPLQKRSAHFAIIHYESSNFQK